MARDTDAPVPDALLVTQIDRDDDRTKEKVEAGVKEKKVVAKGIISEVAATEAAHRQFTDRLKDGSRGFVQKLFVGVLQGGQYVSSHSWRRYRPRPRNG